MQLNKLNILTQLFIYIISAFLIGFGLAWGIHLIQLGKIKRAQNSLAGFLESEKLIKERLQKENSWVHEIKEAAQTEYELKILELQAAIKTMDEDILLLQKNNE